MLKPENVPGSALASGSVEYHYLFLNTNSYFALLLRL
jgi:hypothetical protein